MKKVSKRQAAINREVRRWFLAKAKYYNWICPGCNQRKHLTPSHLIRRSQRPDLVTNPLNISPDCLDCHNIQDSGNVERMKYLKDFPARMSVINKLDPNYYYRLTHKN